MALIQCFECQKSVSHSAESCPHCGFQIAKFLAEQEKQRLLQEAERVKQHRLQEQARFKASKKKRDRVGCLVLFLILMGCSLFGFLVQTCEGWKEEKAVAEKALVEAERVEELRENLDDHLKKTDELLAKGELPAANQLIASLEEASGDNPGVRQRRTAYQEIYRDEVLKTVDELLEKENFHDANPFLSELERLEPENEKIHERRDRYTNLDRKHVAEKSLEKGREILSEGKVLEKSKDWIASEESYQAGLDMMQKVHEDFSTKEHRALHRDLERALSRTKPRAEKDRIKLLAEAAYRQQCGDKPGPTWNGSVMAVQLHLRRTAHDPKSIEMESCTNPVLTSDKCWRTSCVYRGKNAFGAKIRNSNVFFIQNDKVFDVK